MTRLQQELIMYITITNVYNSILAEVFLQFKKKDEILVGGLIEVVLFCVQCSGSSSSMDDHPPLAGLKKTCCCSRLQLPD
jgi:hypothetical protein